MTQRQVDELIDTLAADARPVRPLPAPMKRAMMMLGAIGLSGLLAIWLLGDSRQLFARYSGREALMVLEMAAILSTGMLAVIGAFFLAIPGRSRRWLLAPLPPLMAWLLLSGAGCYADLLRSGSPGQAVSRSVDCLGFILAVSLPVAGLLIWRLSRASPIDPLPVASLGGLGAAALAAFLLQFFHPFSMTFIDLAVHAAAILLVVGIAALLNRRALAPA
jgi:hypothetical protein